MKEDKNIWQDKFSGMKAPLDKDALWNDISKDDRFPRKKKYKKFLFILLFFVFIPLICFLIKGQLNTNDASDLSLIDKNVENNSINKNSNILNNSTKKLNKNNNNLANKSKIILNERNNINSNKTTTLKNIAVDEFSINAINFNKNLSSNSPVNLEKSHDNSVGNNPPVNTGTLNDHSVYNASVNTKTFNNHNNPTADSPINTGEFNHDSVSQNKGNTPSKPKTLSDEKKEEKGIQEPELKEELITNKSEEENIIEDKKEESIILLDSLNMLLTNPFSIEKDTSLKKLKVINDKKWAISLGTGLGYSLFSYSHQDTLPVIDSTYIENAANVLQRKNNTTNILSFRHSLQVERLIKKNWFVGAGIQYTSSNQRFDYKNTEEGDINVFEDSTGIYVTQLLTHTNYELYHNYKTLDVNISFAKKIEFKHIDVIARAGISFNTSFTTKGNYVNNNMNLARINEDNIYKKSLGISGFAELGISKPISSSLSLYSTFSYHSPIRLTQKNSYLKQKSNSIFLNVGLKYEF